MQEEEWLWRLAVAFVLEAWEGSVGSRRTAAALSCQSVGVTWLDLVLGYGRLKGYGMQERSIWEICDLPRWVGTCLEVLAQSDADVTGLSETHSGCPEA